MGKKPAEIQREIAQQRATIERRIHALEDRVTDDVRDAGHAVTDELGERTHINDYAAQRPMTTVLGAFGAGVFLGMKSGSGGRKANGRAHRSSQREDDGGFVSELLGTASGAIGGTLQTEVRQLIRDVLGNDERREPSQPIEPDPLGSATNSPGRFRP